MLLKINHIQGNPEQETGPCFLLQMHLRSYRRSRNIPLSRTASPLSFLVWFSVLNGFQGRFCPWSGVLEVMVCKSSPHHTGKCGGPFERLSSHCSSQLFYLPLFPPAATGWRHHTALDTRSASSCTSLVRKKKTTQIKQNTEAPTATIASAMNNIPIPA